MNASMVGFGFAALDAVKYYEECKKKYLPRMQIKYDREKTPSSQTGDISASDDSIDSDDDAYDVKVLLLCLCQNLFTFSFYELFVYL